MQLNLPEDLSPELRRILEENRAIVEATIKPYVEIRLKPHRELSLWQSKVGGVPYLPKSIKYPTNPDGDPLQLLAQINFEEVPKLGGFPGSGILQFYISGNDDLDFYGANYESPTEQAKFRVLYFAEIDKDESNLITNFRFLPEFEWSPIGDSSAQMEFELYSAPITPCDYRFDEALSGIFSSSDYELAWEYSEHFSSESGHRIGGYPGFTQTDPRSHDRFQDYILLFQLDTYFDNESGIEIMWGDAGIGNFFITEDALKRLDFSAVLYNWDCC